MSRRIYIDWENDHFTWDTEIRLWEEVYIIIEDLLEASGARNPQEWCEHPFDLLQDECRINEIKDQLERNLERMSSDNKNKLIEILIKIGDAEVKEKRKSNKDIKLTVENIQTIAKNLLTVEITNIKE